MIMNSVIFVLSCLSYDYNVEFIEQGGRMPRDKTLLLIHEFNFLNENVYAKQFSLSTRMFMLKWTPKDSAFE